LRRGRHETRPEFHPALAADNLAGAGFAATYKNGSAEITNGAMMYKLNRCGSFVFRQAPEQLLVLSAPVHNVVYDNRIPDHTVKAQIIAAD
jgi:hypothetical protein